MKVTAARLAGARRVELTQRELELAEDEVLVQTHQASICDADLRAYRGLYMPEDLPSFEFPGHEGGGRVVEVGSRVRRFKPGDFVMLFGPHNSMAPYFKAREDDLHLAPEGMDPSVAALGEPIAVGMFGVFQSNVQLGDQVVVTGLNFQGLIAVQGLKGRGARTVIAVDYSDAHLRLAQKLGADITVDTTRDDALAAILDLTHGRGADVVFHSCGYWNPRAEEYFNLSIQAVCDEGTLVSLPDMMGPITTSLHRLHHHGVEVRFPALMHHGPDFRRRWVPRVLRPVAEGLIQIKPLITASRRLEEVAEAFRLFDEDPDQVKVILTP